MKSKTHTRQALFSSVIALVLCCTTLLGSTFAWFTDSVESENNLIQSGNLDIEVEYTLDGENWNDFDGAKDLFGKGLWEPGHTEVVALRIENAGSLALKYAANMNIVEEVVGKNKDGGNIVLSDILTVTTITHEVNEVGDILLNMVFGGSQNTDTSATKAFKSSNILASDQDLLAGAAHYVIITVDMAETVGNEANHDGVNAPSITFGMNVLATQFTYENDSFGNQYDKDAEYPEFSEPKNPALNPDDGSTPVNGDTYVDGDYTYTYDTDEGGWYLGKVSDTSKTSYDPILESINGEPVVLLYQTFLFCSKMTEAPAIPDGVQKLDMTFRSCSALTEAPVIPDSVTSIVNAFQYCTALTTAPAIPDSVTSLNGAFNGCTALTTAPVIPGNVTRLYDTFSGCTALTGTITINTNKIDNNTGYFDGSCRECFKDVDMTNITLAGAASKDVLNLIGATGNNWTPIQ